ncbi:hypothetical protein IAT40_000296 [Kwoniella sp. CBS 6097]
MAGKAQAQGSTSATGSASTLKSTRKRPSSKSHTITSAIHLEPYTPKPTPKRGRGRHHAEAETPFLIDETDLPFHPSTSGSKSSRVLAAIAESDDTSSRTMSKRSRSGPVISLDFDVADSSSQTSPRTPKRKRRATGVVSSEIKNRRKRARSASDPDLDLTQLEENDDETPNKNRSVAVKTATIKSSRIPNHASTLPSPSLSPVTSPLRLSSPESFRWSVEESDEDLPGLKEFLALCAPDAESEPEEQIVVQLPTRKEKPFKRTPLPIGVSIGDPVFVRQGYNWWFGKLVGYTPADNLLDQKRGRDIWTVQSMLGKGFSKKPEGNVMTVHDERIATCTLGNWQTSQQTFTSDALVRPPTPVPPPSLSPDGGDTFADPETETSFDDLSRSEQMIAIRPHLQRIILDEYPPARWRADLFFGSAKERASLNQKVGYGDIHENEVAEVIIPELKRWMRRDEVIHGKGKHGQPPKPIGSDRYSKIPPARLQEYLENVLLPEAVIELCIRSYELTADGDDDEDDPYNEGGTADEDDLLLLEDTDDDDDDYDDDVDTGELASLDGTDDSKTQVEESIEDEAWISRNLGSTSTSPSNLKAEMTKTNMENAATLKTLKASISAENPFLTTNHDPNSNTRIDDPVFKVYDKARLKLARLHAENDYKQWESVAAQLNLARRKMRKKLGLPEYEPRESQEQKALCEASEVENGRAQRSIKKKKIDYRE